MSDFDPVEIRLDLIQNVDSEGEKSTAAINDIAAASNKMKAQFEKDIVAQKTMITQLVNELKILKETMAKKVDSGDEKQAIDKQKLIEQIDILNKKLIEQQRILEKLRTTPAGPASKTTLPGLPADPAAYAKGVNTLNFSMQQIARELPNFAISPMIGIMSLSNNLPILQDSLNKMIAVNKALKESGQATIPVWKQITSSLFSMQTALIAGITVMMLYGKEIGTWVSDLFKSKDALSQLKRAQEELRLATIDGQKSAQGEISRLELLYDTTTDVTKSINERNAAVDELQKTYPDYFRNIDNETLKTGNAADAYDKLRKSIIDAAIAKAYEKKITENQTKIIELEEQKALKVAEFNRQIASSSVVSKTRGGSQIRVGFGVAKASFSQSDIDDLNKEIETLTAQIEEYSKNINITDLLFGGKEGKGGKDSGAKVLGIYDELVQKIHDTGKAILNSAEAERPALQEKLRLLLAQRDAWEAIIKAQRGETTGLKNVPPVKANVATVPVDNKTLGNMKQLTAEQRRQLEIMAKAATLEALKNDPEKLEEEARLREDIARYALQLVDALTAGLDLTEEQAAALNGAMNTIAQLGQGDYIGAAISGLTTAVTAIMDTSGIEEKLSRPWEEFEDWISRSNDALERYIKLRDEAIGGERYTTSDKAIQEAQAIKQDAEAKLNSMKLSWTFKDSGWGKSPYNNVYGAIDELEKKLGGGINLEGDQREWGIGGVWKRVKQVVSYDLSKMTKDAAGNFSLDKLRELIKNGTVADEAVVKAVADYDANMDKLVNLQKEKQQLLTATMASSIADSIIEGFKNGYDSAADFADNFEGLMEDAVLNAVKIKALEEPLKKWYDQFSLDMESGGGLDENEKSILKKWWDDIVAGGIAASSAALDAAGIDTSTSSDRTGSAKGIAQASQDSVDELNGRMTAIQAYIYDIRNMNQQSFDFEKEALAYDAAILSQLETIAENTDYCKYLENMDRVLSDIQLKGVKLKS